MKKVALPLLLIGLLLAGVWWWRGRDKPTVATTTPTAPMAATTNDPRPRPQPTGEQREQAMPILMEDDPKGELPLEGIVFDASDKPVAGATVAVSANPPQVTTTGEDGTFRFPDLVGRTYTLTARAEAGVAGPLAARLTATSEPVVLRLRPGSDVAVAVVSSDGKPVASATVELRDIDTLRATTDDSGRAKFTQVVQGGYDLAAWAPGKAKTFTFLRVTPGANETTIQLVSGAAVSGRVVDPSGNPVASARVRYAGASDWAMQADERLDSVVADGSGQFRFEALPAGSFRFYATAAGFATGYSGLVELNGAAEKRDVVVAMQPGAVVAGVVVDSNKAPVSGARVRVGVRGRGMFGAAPRQAYADAAGKFEINGLPRSELAAVAISDVAASATLDIDTTQGDKRDVTLTLDLAGTITGIVVDASGQPLEGVQVSAGPNFRRTPDGRSNPMANFRLRGMPEDLTDSGGRFTLTGLAEGSYTLRAARSRLGGRRGPGGPDGVDAEAGAKDVKIVLPAEASLKGKLAFADGTAPKTFSAGLGFELQTFIGGDGTFTLENLAPGTQRLGVRGPQFEAKTIEVELVPGKQTDVGTITVAAGRRLAGVVTHNGSPVAGATVTCGQQIFGSGSSSQSQMGPMGRGNKTATTEADGSFVLSGFGAMDLTIVAEHPDLGRSKAQIVAATNPNQQALEIALTPYGALAGVIKQNGKPAEGTIVSVQSTTVPGSIYTVASGPDGAFRFDKLAPDEYKASATIGMPMIGMRFYSKVVTVLSGKQATVDLVVAPGTINVEVKPVANNGTMGSGSVWLVSGVVAAKTSKELGVAMAAAGAGASQWQILRGNGGNAKFVEVVPGGYSACVVALPEQVRGMAAMEYSQTYADVLPCVCQQITVAPSPNDQQFQVPVSLPPMMGPTPGGGSGSGGAGSGAGSNAPPPN